MIRHSVIFKLKLSFNSLEKEAFFEAVNKLAEIPDVKNFEVLKQISPKNKFEYGISMEFDNEGQYNNYSIHKDHQSFIQHYWIEYIEDFLEIDYTIL
jgi:hypothetical protein